MKKQTEIERRTTYQKLWDTQYERWRRMKKRHGREADRVFAAIEALDRKYKMNRFAKY